MNANETIELTDLEPQNEVNGGGTVGVRTNGALLNVSGNNTWAGATTVGGNLQIASLTSAAIDPS